MMFSSLAARRGKFAGPVFATALAMGFVAAAATTSPALAKDAKAAATNYSPKFVAAAGPLQTALQKQKGQKPDAATIDSLSKQLDAATAAATTPDDKYALGGFAISLGSMTQNTALQAKGVQLLLDSGKAPAEQLPKLHFYAGQFAYQANDYATAQTELHTAIAAGYTGSDALTALAEAQFATKQIPDGLATLQKAIDAQKASGQPVPDSWYKRGIGVAYNAKLASQAAQLAAELVAAYPVQENWTLAIQTLRAAAQYPRREELDLFRLMGRTNSFSTGSEYFDYSDDADPHRLPGEAKAALEAGIAAGKLSNSDLMVTQSLAGIDARIAADKATLPGLDRDAHAAGATGTLLINAGDAFLTYGQPAKAAELYQLALTKPGVDSNVALTRLGIAQVDSGDFAGAQASFGKVTGARAPLAQLWTVYAQSKAAGK